MDASPEALLDQFRQMCGEDSPGDVFSSCDQLELTGNAGALLRLYQQIMRRVSESQLDEIQRYFSSRAQDLA